MPRPVPVPPGRPTVPGAHSDEMVNRPRVVPTTRGEPGVPRQPDPMSPCAARGSTWAVSDVRVLDPVPDATPHDGHRHESSSKCEHAGGVARSSEFLTMVDVGALACTTTEWVRPRRPVRPHVSRRAPGAPFRDRPRGARPFSPGSSGTLRGMKQGERQEHLDRLAAVRELVRELETAVESEPPEEEPDEPDDQPGLEELLGQAFASIAALSEVLTAILEDRRPTAKEPQRARG